MVSIRKALPEDVEIVSRLFRKTIKTINALDYDPIQLQAWSAKYEDLDWWMERVRNDHFVVAEDDKKILGFCSISTKGRLDLLYVHKDFQGNGIGSALMVEVNKYFNDLSIREITSEVSITARPFFEKMGFHFLRRQIKNIDGIEITNYVMKKKISR